MLTGFALWPDGRAETFRDEEAVLRLAPAADATVWIDLEAPEPGLVERIGRLYAMDEGSIEDCLHGEQRPRIDDFGDTLFMVFYGATGAEDNGEFNPRKLSILLRAKTIITVQREPLRTVRALRARCETQPHALLGRGVDFLLYAVIDGIVDNYLVAADRIEERVDALEERSIADGLDEGLVAEINSVRRDLLELRSLASSQRELVSPLARGEFDTVSESLGLRFSHVRDHLTRTIELIDNLREVLIGVRENFYVALQNRMNNIVKLLTIFASLFLPMTLLAGIYGMNLPLWPNMEDPNSFWGVLGAMGVIAVAMLAFFRLRRWI